MNTFSRIQYGHALSSDLDFAEHREWLVTNGTGSYGSGTVANLLTRSYHGLLIAALTPPVERTLLAAKLDDTITYREQNYDLFTNRWRGGSVAPAGHVFIERFWLENMVPTWRFGLADAILEKRIWMEPGQDTTYVSYTLVHAADTVTLRCKALVDYRDHNSRTTAGAFPDAVVQAVPQGVQIRLVPGGRTVLLLAGAGTTTIANDWYQGFDLARERERGLQDWEDLLHVAQFDVVLTVGQPLVFALSAEQDPTPDAAAFQRRQDYTAKLGADWARRQPVNGQAAEPWFTQALWAADQFIVKRLAAVAGQPDGKSIIAGYHWFNDWGRDTMISLPGLAICTGHAEVARQILTTFAPFISQGMLPNNFPDQGSTPQYNTMDATLWYFVAAWYYYQDSHDLDTVNVLFPILADMIDWHQRGTRYDIHVDPTDGLLAGGQAGVQLTWMDAIVNGNVITPRIGKPVEINALWYSALCITAAFAGLLGKDATPYKTAADRCRSSFQRFWNAPNSYCFDVLDGPGGDEDALRPNQLFAISLPPASLNASDLMTDSQKQDIIGICEARLLTFTGLRSLDPQNPAYRGTYDGDQAQRDSAYHQGTVWAWLMGPFLEAHLRTFHNKDRAEQLLEPLIDAMLSAGIGTLAEIFEGDAPMAPRGCIAQAWSIAELLRVWTLLRSQTD